jgi:hypothetical protein
MDCIEPLGEDGERERWIPNGPIRAHPFISSKYAKPSEKKNDVTPSFSLSQSCAFFDFVSISSLLRIIPCQTQ